MSTETPAKRGRGRPRSGVQPTTRSIKIQVALTGPEAALVAPALADQQRRERRERPGCVVTSRSLYLSYLLLAALQSPAVREAAALALAARRKAEPQEERPYGVARA